MTTHNNHLDTARAINQAYKAKTNIPQHDLACAAKLASNARLMLIEAYRLCSADNVLRIRAETAGRAVKDLMTSADFRLGEFQ